MDEPAQTRYHVRLGGYIHVEPWYLPDAVIPSRADQEAEKRIPSGQFTPWLDLAAHAGGASTGASSAPEASPNSPTSRLTLSRRLRRSAGG